MDNKKGFQITISMLVVIILSIVILSAGVSIFYKGYNQVSSLKETVDSDTQQRLDNLMTSTDSLLAIPFTSKEVERGDSAIFNLGINNELGLESTFYVCVSYSGTSADYSETSMPNYYDVTGDSEWLLMHDSVKKLTVSNNERAYIPMGFEVPKKILNGQYVFNIVVKYWDGSIDYTDPVSYSSACSQDYGLTQYSTTQKIYLTVK